MTTNPQDLDALVDLIGELGREVYYLLDDCETSGPVGEEVHAITTDGLNKVSAILDRIEALPFEVPGVILGPGAMLQEALKQTRRRDLQSARAAAYERGVRAAAAKMAEPSMLGLTITKMEQCILALLTQEGR